VDAVPAATAWIVIAVELRRKAGESAVIEPVPATAGGRDRHSFEAGDDATFAGRLDQMGEEGMEAGAEAGAIAAAEGLHVFSEDETWDVVDDIPSDSAAALILLEHHWAVPLRDAIGRAGGFRIGDAFVSPADLVEIGMLSAEDAKEMQAADAKATATVSPAGEARPPIYRSCY
jgi:hypothetical protein